MPVRGASLHALQVFDAVARRMSFTDAAEEMRLTQGAISYQIRQLEDCLGVALFHRRGRSIELTVEGLRLWSPLRRSLGQIDAAVDQVSTRGHVRLTVSLTTYFGGRWLLPRLSGFMHLRPEVEIRLVHPPLGSSKSAADADVSVRWGKGDWPDGGYELLFDSPLVPVCARTLVRGANRRPSGSLRGLPILHDELREPWAEWFAKAGVDAGILVDGPVISDPNLRIQAAIDGQGVTLADELVQSEFQSGRLVRPFDVALEGYGYYVAFGSGSRSVLMKEFHDWLRSEAGETRRAACGKAETRV